MSTYKLTYFNITGLGEPIRFLLSCAGVAFEDNRIAHADWPELKPKTPLEQLPVLEIDGKTFFQSNAIIRYLAKKFDVNGSDDLEAFRVDVALETLGDLRQLIVKWFFNPNAAEKAAAEAETRKKAAFYFGKFETAIEKNDGHIVAGKLSAADIVLAASSEMFAHALGKDLFADYPKVQGLIEKVRAIPNIKAYIAKRPKVDF